MQSIPYFLSSLHSPEHFQSSIREYNICKETNEASFEMSRDSGEFFREDLDVNSMPKLFTQRLNFNRVFVTNKDSDEGVNEKLMLYR